jgi:hypothetical protein
MDKTNNVKVVVFVPISDADNLRQAIGNAGAGKIGDYSFCSFSSRGIGRFKPEVGASPAIGSVGNIESVEEERIEFVCDRDILDKVIRAIKKVHPYEEIALDVYPIEMFGVYNKK